MAKSKTAQANYANYKSENRAATNKAAKAVRHAKKHPNDKSKGGLKGRTQDIDNRPTKFEASIRRAVKHHFQFDVKKAA